MKLVKQTRWLLALMMMCAMGLNAQNRVELEDAMFKAWDGWLPGSNVMEEPQEGFICENNMWKESGGGTTIYGNNSVYYLWYADLTGTDKMYFEGTAGLSIRVILNRQPPLAEGAEGYDKNGSTYTEILITLNKEGKYELDLTGYSSIHLNAIKLPYGGTRGEVRKIELEGTVESTGEVRSPLKELSFGYENDVICISLGGQSNLSELMGNLERLVFPKECVSVKVDGNPCTLFSVEGMSEDRLFVFIDEGYSMEMDANVEVSFTNPTDPAYHLTFINGRWRGQDIPSFTDMVAPWQEGLGNYYTYKAAVPQLVNSYPEDGSFNLPFDLKEISLEFSAVVNCETLTATLAGEQLTVTPATGYSKEVTLTRNGGELSVGEYLLIISNIEPEVNFLEQSGEEIMALNFGPVNTETTDQPKDILPMRYFTESKQGGIPEGYLVLVGNPVEERIYPNTYGSGARMMVFAEGGDFTHGLYFRDNYVLYGMNEGYELPLEAGKKYTIQFKTAAWKGSGFNMLFEIYNSNDEVVYSNVVSNECDMNGNTSAKVQGATAFKEDFIPDADDNYTLKWTPASDANGTPGSWNEVLLADVEVRYMPNIAGVAEMMLVNTAIANADSVLASKADARYEGVAMNNLKNCVEKYKSTNFTTPSGCQVAAAELDAMVTELKEHCNLCDTYDQLQVKAAELVVTYMGTKFELTEYYKAVGDMDIKYQNRVLMEDVELTEAINELTVTIDLAEDMFTEGVSKCGMTGYAVLIERIRSGMETAMLLGAAPEENVIVRAYNALSDDDELANELKRRIKQLLYGKLKEEDNTLFDVAIDENTGMEVYPSFDMTVFVKNPNFYKLKADEYDYSQENIPGWIVEGNANISTGWSAIGTDGMPVDAMISTWGTTATATQTIADLPAGVYTLTMGFGERLADDPAYRDSSFMFVRTSATPEGEYTDTVNMPLNTVGGFPVDNVAMEGIVVTDGQLTFGIHADTVSHMFFNEVKLFMTAPANGYNYGNAYAEGIEETTAQTATVRAIEIYNMNGQPVNRAKNGVFIIRKFMTDGTIRTEKVVK